MGVEKKSHGPTPVERSVRVLSDNSSRDEADAAVAEEGLFVWGDRDNWGGRGIFLK